MNDIEKLAEYFKEFPGIGPRQAKRFVYFLLRKNNTYVKELANLIPKIRENIINCDHCQRYFSKKENQTVCEICLSKNRDVNKLLVVARDTDFEAIEKSNSYDGYYFILGGLLPHLEADVQKFIRIDALKKKIDEQKPKEIILALSVNPDGDNTTTYLRGLIKQHNLDITISTLGRGLSTGSELEYADKSTILSALENRK